eukprot:m.900658 g.900658  ORF g.900658 m.900658 type:complete len:796 (-) comp60047_c0_seq2:2027-4414(-)
MHHATTTRICRAGLHTCKPMQTWPSFASFIPDFTPRLKPFPYPSYLNDPFITLIKGTLPLLLVLSYLYTAISMVRALVHEKEQRMREAMKMMGLPNWILWFSWFLKNLIFISISVAVITIVIKVSSIFRYSDVGLVFVFLMLFAISTILLCFLISTFFDRASVSAAGAGLIYFATYGPYLYLQFSYDSQSFQTKQSACLLSTTCVGIGMNIFSIFEARGEGLNFGNLQDAPSDVDNYTMAHVLGMLVLDCVIYLILTWYIDAVFPGKFGVPRGYLFFVKPSYWLGAKRKRRPRTAVPLDRIAEDLEYERAAITMGRKKGGRLTDSKTGAVVTPQSSSASLRADFEPDPMNLHAGIRIENLRKEFDDKIAVHGLTLNMYEDQITALLGHNGAGKTTTMSMLVGMFPPSSGTALINDYDVVTESDGARTSLGLCPQFDILFDMLTVEEHIFFFSQLKGGETDVKAEIDQFVKDLDLEPKRKAFAGTLSGGQKRALSCGIAFCGGSRVVILDEPTSGMDPFKRRQTWEVLLKYKKGRTILLTTHFMDEADLLCERIAILSDGRLRCCGSSSFLKSRFGTGYHMTLVKLAGCNTAQVERNIKHFVPAARCVSDVGSELAFILPFEDLPSFPSLLEYFDERKTQLGISSYGVSVTTLEDVFLKVGHSAAMQESQEEVELTKAPLLKMQFPPLSGFMLIWSQFCAMIMKRVMYTVRSKPALFAQLVLPVLFFIITILIASLDSGTGTQPIRPFALNGYYNSKTARLWPRYWLRHDIPGSQRRTNTGHVGDFGRRSTDHCDE